jgi:hypothetical protein
MKLSRRHVLAAAALGATGVGLWRFHAAKDEDGIVAVLKKRLDYLQLDEAGVHAFAMDLAGRKSIDSTKLRLLAFGAPLYEYTDVSAVAPEYLLEHGEERIVSLYLLSSDFFRNGSDESRLVRYVAFYDPLTSPMPCANPFFRAIGA